MTQKVTYIASSSYSGSTILELLLTTTPHVVGIGEAYQFVDPRNPVINRAHRYTCACGAAMDQCDLWKPIVQHLRNHQGWSARQKYASIFQHVARVYGSDSIIIDSSKRAAGLALIAGIPEIEFNVVHIIRDVRAYLVSMRKNQARKQRHLAEDPSHRHDTVGISDRIRQNSLYIFQNWYNTNKTLSRMIDQLNLSCLTLNYEDLCLDTEQTLDRLSRFLGLEIHPDRMSAPGTHNHNIFGNRLRRDPRRRSSLNYDDEWVHQSNWHFAAMIMPHVMKYNNKRFPFAPSTIAATERVIRKSPNDRRGS